MTSTYYINLFSLNQVSLNTAYSYKLELVRFFQFTQTSIKDIHIAHILKYRHSLLGYHPTTIAWKISVIRSFFSFLVQERIVTHNPAISVKSPRVKKHPQFPNFNQTHFKKLLSGSKDNSFYSLRDCCLIRCMGQLGLRVSEVRSLRLESMDDNNEFPCLLIIGKGNSIRSVPLINGIQKTIDQYLIQYPFEPKPNSPLFPASTKTERPLSPRGIQYIVQRYCKRAGLSDQITPHTLRHFALSTLLHNGHDIFTIQTFAGHSQLATTARYLHNLNQQEHYFMNIMHENSLIRTIPKVSE